ncbi:hypothetical protein BS329_36765 [Amycolatopsis coloradensis]|uniref:Uncharacterized protein n=1 Tax=Amycolatopsis coloradensis TaxID=76021 RepID=A0A1R0KFX6_9PSEU|nr:hypothetical protein [Amycolatopsis coloradensis]OLZ44391.1 hypothetical protein BS329_36765 [Amycolatopsis coloradensis]
MPVTCTLQVRFVHSAGYCQRAAGFGWFGRWATEIIFDRDRDNLPSVMSPERRYRAVAATRPSLNQSLGADGLIRDDPDHRGMEPHHRAGQRPVRQPQPYAWPARHAALYMALWAIGLIALFMALSVTRYRRLNIR